MAANLSNADFRTLLMTPKPGQQSELSKPGRSGGNDVPVKKKKWRPPVKQEEKEEGSGASYRDRALERRDDSNPDYAGNQELLGAFHAVPPPSQGGVAQGPGAPAADRDINAVSIEESKFLGGDMEHTHLVKGLDFALLSKVRSENLTKETTQRKEEVQTKPKFAFTKPIARNIHNILFTPASMKVAESFLPGRTGFVIEMDEDSQMDIPTKLSRPKDECPAAKEKITGRIDGELMGRISRILTYVRQAGGRSGKKMKRKPKFAAPEAMAAPKVKAPIVVDDEDIYADAGMYDATAAAAAAAPAGPAMPAPGGGGYFGEKDMGAAPGAMMPPPPPPGPSAGPSGPPPMPMAPPPLPEGAYPNTDAAYPNTDAAYPNTDMQYNAYPNTDAAYPNTDAQYGAYPNTDAAYPNTDAAYPNTDAAYPNTDAAYPNTDAAYPNTDMQYGSAPPLPPADLAPPKPKVPEEDYSSLQTAGARSKKHPAQEEGAYSECYPDYDEGFAHEIGGSDDDDDLTKMDMGKAGKGLRRADFDDDDEYFKYKANQEAAPRAVFQFGQKMGDGRKTRKEQNRKKEDKFNRDFQRIQQIMKRKEEGGASPPAERFAGEGGHKRQKVNEDDY